MKTSKTYALLTLAIALILGACAPAALRGSRDLVAPEPGLVPYQGGAVSESAAVEAPFADTGVGGEFAVDLPAAADRLVIRNASLSVVVKDPAQSIDQISSLAEGMGGFVVSSNLYQTTVGTSGAGEPILANRGSITIRVPVERLDDALGQIKSGVIEVQNENVNGQDVTEEFTDLQSRLRNLEAAESQLLKIMEAATKTEDVLKVFNELKSVREEIEVVRGRIQYLQNSADLSAISVDLIPDAAAQPIQIGRWTPTGTAKEAVEALVNSLQVLADAGIWALIYVLPLVLLVLAVIFFPARAVLRRLRRGGSTARPESA